MSALCDAFAAFARDMPDLVGGDERLRLLPLDPEGRIGRAIRSGLAGAGTVTSQAGSWRSFGLRRSLHASVPRAVTRYVMRGLTIWLPVGLSLGVVVAVAFVVARRWADSGLVDQALTRPLAEVNGEQALGAAVTLGMDRDLAEPQDFRLPGDVPGAARVVTGVGWEGAVVAPGPEEGHVSVALLAHLRLYSALRPKTAELRNVLLGRAIVWLKDNDVDDGEAERVLAPTVCSALLVTPRERAGLEKLRGYEAEGARQRLALALSGGPVSGHAGTLRGVLFSSRWREHARSLALDWLAPPGTLPAT
jgi:hypothetical protein